MRLHRQLEDRSRRCFVLIAVLVVVASALLVATTLLFSAQGLSTASAGAADSVQSRALAWSGLQAVMSRLGDQRERILAGEVLRLDSQYTIYETATRLGVIRLLPMSAGEAERYAAPESARIDINYADADALARTGLLDSATAQAIVNDRDQRLKRPFQSVGELLNLPAGASSSIGPESLYGPIEEIRPVDEAQLMRGDLAQRVAARLGEVDARTLSDLLTVFSAEPALQHSGEARINLNAPWSDDLAQAVLTRFDQAFADALKSLYERGVRFEHPRDIFRSLRELKVPPEDWPEIVDTFTTDAEKDHFGRLDINTAPYEALLSLPGITAEQASQMISVREELSPQERATIAWPAIAQIVMPESYDQLADKMTTRSWSSRVRLAAGEVNPDAPEGLLEGLLIYEAVIDLSSEQPRVAYLRDISQLQGSAMWALEASRNQLPTFEVSSENQAEQKPMSPLVPTATKPEAASQPVADSTVKSKVGEKSSEDQSPPVASPSETKRIGRWRGG